MRLAARLVGDDGGGDPPPPPPPPPPRHLGLVLSVAAVPADADRTDEIYDAVAQLLAARVRAQLAQGGVS